MTQHQTFTRFFEFERDFVEDDIRCIPMIVRFKLDACGIKLKLSEWSKMNSHEREMLASWPCHSKEEIDAYRSYVEHLVLNHTGIPATPLASIQHPEWSDLSVLPQSVIQRIADLGLSLTIGQWQRLDALERFSLVKLSSSVHEHKNFKKALFEFKLL